MKCENCGCNDSNYEPFLSDFTEKDRDELIKLIISGLGTDGEHHKQWYLEEVLKKVGFPLEKIKDYGIESWEPGRAP